MSIGGPAVPFTLVERDQQTTTGGGTWRQVQIKRVASGLARLDDDALVLQFRVRETVTRMGGTAGYDQDTTESELREAVVPLAAVRSALVRGLWWWTRLVLAAADLRAFDALPAVRRGEVALRIAPRDRADALELASQLEMALAQRLLSPPDLDRFPSIPPAG